MKHRVWLRWFWELSSPFSSSLRIPSSLSLFIYPKLSEQNVNQDLFCHNFMSASFDAATFRLYSVCFQRGTLSFCREGCESSLFLFQPSLGSLLRNKNPCRCSWNVLDACYVSSKISALHSFWSWNRLCAQCNDYITLRVMLHFCLICSVCKFLLTFFFFLLCQFNYLSELCLHHILSPQSAK